MDIFDVYNFQNQVEKAIECRNFEGILKLLDVVYFDGSLEKGNENRIVFEFSKSCTMAIEVQLMKKKIRFWGWIGTRLEGDYFWRYVFKNYEELWRSVLNLLISEYFSPTESVSCEIVANTQSDLLCQWIEGTEETKDK